MTLIKQRLDIDAQTRTGKTGQFDVIVDGQQIAQRGGNWLTRNLGAGYPNFESIITQIQNHNQAK